jgi:hypothetical protein
MNVWVIVALIFNILLMGIAVWVGYFLGRKAGKEKEQLITIGTFIIDKDTGEIYTVFDIEPKDMQNGDVILMDIAFNDFSHSQETQGS